MTDRETLKSALMRTAGCLTPEQLERAMDGEDSEHPHLATCVRCQSELTLLKSFHSEERLDDEGAAVAWVNAQLESRLPQIKGARSDARSAGQSHSAPGWIRSLFSGQRLRMLVPASVVLAIVAAGALFMQEKNAPELKAGLPGREAVYRSGSVAVVRPVGELSEPPSVLEWRPYPGATHYQAAVMEVDQSVLWSTESIASKVTIPSSVRAKLLPGKTVLWRVKALDAQGRTLATSETERMKVDLRRTHPTP
ncbi:MAG: hypothetical protein H0X25_00970 [Acidobacteriales bacterium]|nr:hypothetical protein [Terriglobales bacterium]